MANGAPGSPGYIEEMYRTAVNRAYYAAFLHARSYCRNQFQKPQAYGGPGAHSDVIKDLRAATRPSEQDAGDSLSSLFGRRKKADYDEAARVRWDKDVVDALQEANDVFNFLP